MHRLNHLKAFHKPTGKIFEVVELGQESVAIFVGGKPGDEIVSYEDRADCIVIEPCEVQDSYKKQLYEYDMCEFLNLSRKRIIGVIKFHQGAFAFFTTEDELMMTLYSAKSAFKIRRIGSQLQQTTQLKEVS